MPEKPTHGGSDQRQEAAPGRRPRLRDLGITVGEYEPGVRNAITDVIGVRVGHCTLRRPPDLHTGVTAVLPVDVNPHAPLPAGMFAGNGYGKLVGATQLAELGVLETPILLTSTLSTFLAADALVGWMLERPGCADIRSLNPVVGECNDGHLSDIRSRAIRAEHVRAALERGDDGPVAMGCVGAGTGTTALGYKAGIGSASRVLRSRESAEPVTIGVLVQANFGGTLRFRGREIPPTGAGPDGRPDRGDALDRSEDGVDDAGEAGSCMVVVATDAPLDARQLNRVARRAVFGLGRVGATYGHGSGDYGIAFSTVPGSPPPDRSLNGVFTATLDLVEEAVLDSLLAADPTTGREGRTVPALTPQRLHVAVTGS